VPSFKVFANRAKTRGVREGRSVPFSALGNSEDGTQGAVYPERFDARGHWAAPPGRWHEARPEDQLLSKETLQRLSAAIEALPSNQRSVMTLRDVEGLDAAEVCNVLDISETNQRVLLHRARAAVRTALEQYFDDGTE
jgi:RNA polymerase sigma-70 factor (ECF subfamily)